MHHVLDVFLFADDEGLLCSSFVASNLPPSPLFMHIWVLACVLLKEEAFCQFPVCLNFSLFQMLLLYLFTVHIDRGDVYESISHVLLLFLLF